MGNEGSGGGCFKTALKIGVVLFLLAGGFVAVLLFYGKSTGEAKVGEFFNTVATASLAEIQKEFHPSLAKAADPQMLAAFCKGIPGQFGPFKSVNVNGFSFSDKLENGMRLQSYEGNMVFEKQELPLKLTFADGKLVGIHLKDEAASKKIFEATAAVPPDTAPYRDAGLAFWQAALTGKTDAAFAMLCEVLQKQLGKGTFDGQLKTLARAGAFQKVEFVKAVPDAEQPNKLHLLYRCTFEKTALNAHVTFQFFGLQSYFLAFGIPSNMAG